MSARRTVSVALEVKAAEARKQIHGTADDVRKLERTVVDTGHGLDKMSRDTAQAGREASKLDRTVRETSRGLDKMAGNAHQAGRAAEKLAAGERLAERRTQLFNRELGQLDRQIDATTMHLKMLGLAYATTGDAGLLKKIAADRSLLSRMRAVRRDLTPSAAPTGPVGTAGGFLSGIPGGPMAIGIAAAAPIVAALVPTISAAVSGAVVGGVGLGGIIGGIALAARDDRVRHEGERFAETFMSALHGSADPFVAPILASMGTLNLAGLELTSALRTGFTTIAPVLTLLARGVEGLVHNVGPGLGKAFEAAKPALRALANELPEIGAALSDMFSSIAKNGDGATMGLLAMLHAVEWLIRAFGSFVGTMSGVFEWMIRSADATTEWGLKILDVAAALSFLGGPAMAAVDAARAHLTALNTETGHLIEGLDKANDSSDDFSGSLLRVTAAEAEAADKALRYKDALEALFGIQMSLDEAQIRYQQAIDDTIKTLQEGKKTLDINTQAGRDNKQAILDEVNSIEALRKARVANGMSVADANRLAGDELDLLRITAERLGFKKSAIEKLIGAYKGIPAKAETTIETPGLVTAQTRLDKVENTLNRLDGRQVRSSVRTDFYSYRHDEVASSRRWGGITEHAADGLLREAKVYSPMGPARYAYAEPATGGELFVPKNGDYGRSMSLLAQGAAWYGATVVPRGGGGTMRVQLEVVGVRATGNALVDAIVSGIQFQVRTVGGGDVNYLAGRR